MTLLQSARILIPCVIAGLIPPTALADEDLEQRIHDLEAQTEALADILEMRDANQDTSNSKLSIGGYGELHYNKLDAEDPSQDINEIDFHRFVLFFGYDFTDNIRFISEIELEHALAGDGKEGEIELEQAYIEFQHNETATTQTGIFLIPVGILNETHEPTTFYGVERNPVENIIIPATWWEAGAQFIKQFGHGLQLNLALHSGLEIPTDTYRIRSGRQKVSKASANNLATTARIKYMGISGFELAASVQFQSDPSQLENDGLEDGTLYETHIAFNKGGFALRTLYAGWDFSGDAIEAGTNSADSQNGWYIEPSYKFIDKIGIYLRTSKVKAARNQDNFEQNEIGLNWWPHSQVVFKIDWRNRDHDLDVETGRDFHGFDLGIGYQF